MRSKLIFVLSALMLIGIFSSSGFAATTMGFPFVVKNLTNATMPYYMNATVTISDISSCDTANIWFNRTYVNGIVTGWSNITLNITNDTDYSRSYYFCLWINNESMDDIFVSKIPAGIINPNAINASRNWTAAGWLGYVYNITTTPAPMSSFSGNVLTLNYTWFVSNFMNISSSVNITGALSALAANISFNLTAINNNITQISNNLTAVSSNVSTLILNLSATNANITIIIGNISGINGNITALNNSNVSTNIRIDNLNLSINTTNASLANYVPYTGAVRNVTLGTHNLFANNIFASTDLNASYLKGRFTNGTLDMTGDPWFLGGINLWVYQNISSFAIMSQIYNITSTPVLSVFSGNVLTLNVSWWTVNFLNISDQRYNETGMVTAMNATVNALNVSNATTNIRIDTLNATITGIASNVTGGTWPYLYNDSKNITFNETFASTQYLNISDQRYNETGMITAMNVTVNALNSSNVSTNSRIDVLNLSINATNASLANYVPYIGATNDVNLSNHNLSASYFFGYAFNGTHIEGRYSNGTLDIAGANWYLGGANLTVQNNVTAFGFISQLYNITSTAVLSTFSGNILTLNTSWWTINFMNISYLAVLNNLSLNVSAISSNVSTLSYNLSATNANVSSLQAQVNNLSLNSSYLQAQINNLTLNDTAIRDNLSYANAAIYNLTLNDSRLQAQINNLTLNDTAIRDNLSYAQAAIYNLSLNASALKGNVSALNLNKTGTITCGSGYAVQDGTAAGGTCVNLTSATINGTTGVYVPYTGATKNVDLDGYNLTASFVIGLPITGAIGGGLLWGNSVDDRGRLNVSNFSMFNVSYPAFLARLEFTNNTVKYCNMSAGNITVPASVDRFYLVTSTCAITYASAAQFATGTASLNGGTTDFLHVMTDSGGIELLAGSTILQKVDVKTKQQTYINWNAKVTSGFAITTETFPNFTIANGEYNSVRDVFPTSTRNGSAGVRIEWISHLNSTTWQYVEGYGLNITGCDTGTATATCTGSSYRRYFIFVTGYNNSGADTTDIHQMLALESKTYSTVADCLNTVVNPLTYTLPDEYTYSAVKLYAYCAKRTDSSWTSGNFIDMRTVSSGTATAITEVDPIYNANLFAVGMNQYVATTSDVVFNSVNATNNMSAQAFLGYIYNITSTAVLSSFNGNILTLNTSWWTTNFMNISYLAVLNNLSLNLSAVSSNVTTLSYNLSATNANVSSLQAQVNNITFNTSSLQAQINNLTLNDTAIRDNLSYANAAIYNLTLNDSRLQAQINNLTLNDTAIRDNLSYTNAAIYNLTINDSILQAQINNLTFNDTAIRDNLTTLSYNLSATNANVSSLQAQVNNITFNTSGIQAQINNLTLNDTAIRDNLTTLSYNLSATNANVSSLISTNYSIWAYLLNITFNLSALNNNLSTLSYNLSATNANVSEISYNLSATNANVSSLINSNFSIWAYLLNITFNLSALNSNLSTLSYNLSATNANVSALINSNTSTNLRIDSLNNTKAEKTEIPNSLPAGNITNSTSFATNMTFNNSVSVLQTIIIQPNMKICTDGTSCLHFLYFNSSDNTTTLK